MELREIYDFGKGTVITEKSKLPAYALAKIRYSFARADQANANNRIYPESILVREIEKKSEELKRQKIAGMLEHPLDGFTKLDKTMHALSAISYDRETKLAWAESYVLDTSGGRDFMTLLRSGLRLGASMRGTGNVGQDRRVQDDYKLISVDFVANPSFGADAIISQDNLIESANSLMIDEIGRKEENMELKEFKSIDKLCLLNFNRDVDEGRFRGSFEDWKRKHEIFVRAAVLEVTEGIELSHALEKLGRSDLAEKLINEEHRRILPKDVLFESFMAGCSASEFAKKINENIDREEETTALGFTKKELSFLMAEAMSAGFDINDPGKRNKYLEAYLRNKEVERAAEAKRLEEQQRAEAKKRLAEAKRKETLLSNVKKILEKNGDSPEIVKTLKKILEEA